MRYLSVLVTCYIVGCVWQPTEFAHKKSSSAFASGLKLQGGCLTPAAPNENIELDLMHVVIRFKRARYSVDAVYHLFNTGETAAEMVGVPKHGILDDSEWCCFATVHDFLRFDAWVDERKTVFKEVHHFLTVPNAPPFEGFPYDAGAKSFVTRWMAKKVIFPGKTMTVIRVRYEALYDNELSVSEPRDVGIFYEWTGRYWKGKLKKRIVVLDRTDVGVEHELGYTMIPSPRVLTKNIKRYEMHDYEPTTEKKLWLPGTDVGAMRRMFPHRQSQSASCSVPGGGDE